MYFWLILASLMGIITFGNLREKTKDADFYVVPIYESLAKSLLMQHNAVVSQLRSRYLNEGSWDWAGSGAMTVVVNVDNSGTPTYDSPSNSPEPYLPYGFKFMPGYKTAYFCVNKANQDQATACSNVNAVMYAITYASVPARYGGADKMSIPKAIAAGTQNSRFVGLIERSPTILNDGYGQPLGAGFYILSAGYSPAASTFIPNYFICRLAEEVPAIRNPRGMMVALTMIKGLENGENMIATGNTCSWEEEETP